MKTEFKAKFLQHLNQRKQDQGFTLIELLVVIIIIGILAAIALPSFLNQANKAKQSEAKQYLSSINKGQQAYYAENTQFSGDIGALGIGLKTATNNFTYGVTGGSNSANGTFGATATAQPAAGLRPYSSAVGLVSTGGANTTTSVLCEADSTVAVAAPQVGAGQTELNCPTSFSLVTK